MRNRRGSRTFGSRKKKDIRKEARKSRKRINKQNVKND